MISTPKKKKNKGVSRVLGIGFVFSHSEGSWIMLNRSFVPRKMRKSFKDSLKALEADIQFANTL